MGPRIVKQHKRKRWVIVAAIYIYFLLGLSAWANSEQPLKSSFAASHALVVGFGFLDAAPPTVASVGWTCNDEAAHWGDLQASAARIVSCATRAELAAALAAAQPGDYLRIADSVGAVTWAGLQTSVDGTAAAPIIIGPQGYDANGRSNRAVTFSGSGTWIDITHDHYIVGGFKFTSHLGSAFQALNATHLRVTDCRLDTVGNNASGDGWMYQVDYGCTDWRIDHCNLRNLGKNGRVDIYDPASYTNPVRGRFDHNTIDGTVNSSDGASHSACQIGQGSQKYNDTTNPRENGGKWAAYCTFEFNHIANTGGYPEQPSCKSSNNVIRYNWYDGAKAQIIVRQANYCEVYGNYVNSAQGTGAAAIELYGANHQVWANIVHAQSALDTCITEMSGGFRGTTPVPPCENCQIIANTFYDPLGKTDRCCVRFNADPGGITTGAVGCSGETWKNNIILRNNGTYSVAKALLGTSPASSGYTVANNLWYGTSTNGAGYALDSAPVTANPDLDANYSPQVGSGAIAAGVYHTLATIDFLGNPRDISAIDIGAIQTTLSPPAQRGAGLNRGQSRGGFIGGWV